MADYRRRRSPGKASERERRRQSERRPVYDDRRSVYEEPPPEPPRMRANNEPEPYPRMRPSNDRAPPSPPGLSSSDDSSSSSYLDISRYYPTKSGLITFFTAPSERRRVRKRRSSRGLFKISNSSSSSVNSDLAYGTGFIKRSKRSVRSRKGKEIDRERYSERERDKVRDRDRYSDRERPGSGSGRERPGSAIGRERAGSGIGRTTTDAELLALTASLTKLAKDPNKPDLKNARNGKRTEVVAAKDTGDSQYGATRGLAPSRIPHGSDALDDDGWESTSDDESDFSVDSRLAYDNSTKSKWKNFFGRKKYRPKSRKECVVDPKLFGPQNSLHGHVDEPVGFGDVSWNSSTDFGQSSTFSLPMPTPVGPSQSAGGSQQSLKQVEPMPTSDSAYYDAGRGSVMAQQYGSNSTRPGPAPVQYATSQYTPARDSSRFQDARNSAFSGAEPYISRRPEPITLQQPQPIPPRSQTILEPSYPARAEPSPSSILKKTTSSGRGSSVAQSALVGLGGVAAGAIVASALDNSKDRRRQEDERAERERLRRRDEEAEQAEKERQRRREEESEQAEREYRRRREEELEQLERERLRRRDEELEQAERERLRRREEESEQLERERVGRRDSEKKDSKDDRRREKRYSPDRDDRNEKIREKDRRKDESDEKRREKKREKRREDARDEIDDKREKRRDETREERDERRERRREERRSERSDYDSRVSKSEVSTSSAAVDPFLYQVRDDTPSIPLVENHRQVDSAPSIITVERSPDFTRMRSSSIKEQSSTYEPSSPYFPSPDERSRDREERDRPLHKAEEFYHEAQESTAPYDAAIMTSAIAAVVIAEDQRKSRSEERRNERRREGPSDFDEYTNNPADREPVKEKDPVQEDADRAYREIVMARKIASHVARSRTPSPNRSVTEKYDGDEEEPIVRIVTPPEMADHDRKKKGPYDAPNADFRPDYEFHDPRDVHAFSIPEVNMVRSLPQGTLPKRDHDASEARPLLNLVRPTPTPSPAPEEQSARSEASPRRARSKSRDREEAKRAYAPGAGVGTEREPLQTTVSDVVAGPSPSVVSKAVTWGENETKHYEVESPSDHKEEFISNADVPTREIPEEIKQSSSSKTRGWGAIAAGVIGAGIGAVAASSSDSSITSKAKGEEKQPESPFEYRGVMVEPEPDSPPRSQRKASPPREQNQRSPPSPGPKPTSPISAHIPGAFDDDIDFTAHVAAGLKHTGFDPDIVINDPAFRRRDSPPGSNEVPIYRSPFAETVSDLGTIPSEASGARSMTSGFILGEVAETPQDWRSVSPPRDEETPTKLSKKEQKKRDKARRQSGDVMPLDEPSVSKDVVEEPESYFVEPKLSKKEQKKRDKEAQRQRSLDEDATPPFESLTEQVVAEPDSYFVTPKKSKKSKGITSSFDNDLDNAARSTKTVSVSVDEFPDLQNGDDDWTPETKKSKSKRDSDRYDSSSQTPSSEVAANLSRSSSVSKRAKRDSDRYESPSRSLPSFEVGVEERSSSRKSKHDSERYDSPARSEIASEVGSSKKSREKSKRRSESYNVNPTEVSLPPTTPSEISEFDDRRTRKSPGRDSGVFDSADRGDSRSVGRSVVSVGTSRYDEDEPRKSKEKSRNGTKYDFDDTRSVASAPAGDDYEDSKRSKTKEKEKEKKSSGFFGLFGGSKPESSVRDESPKRSKDDVEHHKKKKRSRRSYVPSDLSFDGDVSVTSVSDISRTMSVSTGKSNGYGAHDYDQYEDATRSDDEREKKKSRSRSASTTSKKDSFLGNAGTLGAGAGIAGAAVAIAAQQYQQSKAANTNDSETAEGTRSMSLERPSGREEDLDPDIRHRDFRPSIDPQYGDLLPLPPSDPATPILQPLDDLPELPGSRPDTPEADRVARERAMSSISSFRKSLQETPTKSPSQSAVPLKFLLGNRSSPPSPSAVRASPMQSPAVINQEVFSFPKFKSRPTSWEATKEYRPLYLVESHRRASQAPLTEAEEAALPPSHATSRSSSQHDLPQMERDWEDSYDHSIDPLAIDAALAHSAAPELLGSGQSTPKAAFHDRDNEEQVLLTPRRSGDDYDLQQRRERSPSVQREEKSHLSGEDLAAAVGVAGLATAAGYLLSSESPKDEKTNELPSIERQPSPVDPVTKDRSSYLLQSSPISRKADEPDSLDRNEASPTRAPKHVSSDSDALHSIDEHEDPDALSSQEIQRQREKALESLSGTSTPSEGLTQEAPTREIKQQEPSEELPFMKSKKDKKKDKKRSKGFSKSSIQDDLPAFADASENVQPENAQSEIPAPVEAEAADEFVVKSKKDKKKNKRQSKLVSAWGDAEELPQQQSEEPTPALESIQELPEDPATSDTVPKALESSQELPKDLVISESVPQALESIQELPEDLAISESIPPALGSGQEVPKDLATSDTVPQALESSQELPKDLVLSESMPLALESSQELPRDLTISESIPQADIEPVEAFSVPKAKKGKKGKKKSKSISAFDETENSPQQSEEPAAILDSSRDLSESQPASEPVEPVEPVEVEPIDDFSAPKTKKDKGKKKSKPISALDDTEDVQQSQVSISELSQDILEETPASQIVEPAEEFSTPKSKEDKKGKSVATFEPEPEVKLEDNHDEFYDTLEELSRNVPVESISAPKILPEVAQDISPETVVPIVNTQDEPAEQVSEPKSKKDKKKNKKSKSANLELEEDSTPTTPSEILPEPQQDVIQDTPAPVDEAFGDFGPAKSKKDKKGKKNRQVMSSLESEANNFEIEAAKSMPEASDAPPIADEQADEVSFSKSNKDKKEDKKKKSKSGSYFEPESQALDDTVLQEPSPEIFEEPMSISKNLAPETQADSASPTTFVTEADLPEPGSLDVQDLAAQETSEDIEDVAQSKDVHDIQSEPVDTSVPETSESLSREIQPGDNQDSAQASSAVDDLAPAEKKKSKKKKRKSGFSREPEEDIVTVEASSKEIESESKEEALPETATPDEFVVTDTKKGKKKQKDKSIPSFDLVDDSSPANTSLENASIEEFQAPVSKKDKKKSNKSKKLEEGPAADGMKTVEPENLLPASETPDAKLTPSGGRGAWPITPATPLTGGEAEESSSKGYFPAAAAVIPVVAVGAALLDIDPLKKDSSSVDHSVATISEPIGVEQPDQESVRVVPDGLKAGYKDDQLSLARKLREEFASGRSGSRKDKKKRQSLPSTPDRMPSRSRAVEDLVDSHSRARSLSIGPSAQRFTQSSATTERKNVYSEDQLELARQLKVEFDNKKSKKEKKGRKGRSLTQDDDFVDQNFEQSPARDLKDVATAQQEDAETAPKGDGFAAGYQEDQLSLARQLQAEFGKKSKKGKKSRSTSRTSLDSTPVNDHFGDQARDMEPVQSVEPSNVLESSETVPVRDGLAVGYKEDQLELARQMQEEFAAKKSKKDKKGKKRQSLLRSNTGDEFQSDAPTPDESDNIPTPSENVQQGSGPVSADPEDEIAAVGKKSKKDKKGKKRGSLLRSTTDEDLASDSASKDMDEPVPENPSQPDSPEQTNSPGAIQVEDELAPNTQESKKDKKSKKRDGAKEAEVEGLPASEPRLIENEEPQVISQDTREIVPEPEGEFAAVAKKDKKGKKRESLMQEGTEEQLPSESVPETISESIDNEPPTQDLSESREIVAIEPEGEIASVAKKSKKGRKGKNRDSLMPEPETDKTISESPIAQIDSTEAQPNSSDKTPALVPTTDESFIPLTEEPQEYDSKPLVSEETPSAEPENDLTPVTKKSKKDKKGKKRDSTTPDILSETLSKEEETSRDVSEETLAETESQTAIELVEGDSGFVGKKSKKDKKKRQSIVAQESTSQPESDNVPMHTPTTEELPIAGIRIPATEELPISDTAIPTTEELPVSNMPISITEELLVSDIAIPTTKELPISGTAIPASDSTIPTTEELPVSDISIPTTEELPVSDTAIPKTEELPVSDTAIPKTEELPVSDIVIPTTEELPIPEITAASSAIEAVDVDDPQGNFAISKKSKKDKKKRKSLVQSSTTDETSEQSIEEKNVQRESQEQITEKTTEDVPSVPLEDQKNDDFAKKSKKDKKKRKSMQQTDAFEDLPKESEQSSSMQPEPIVDAAIEEDIQSTPLEGQESAPQPLEKDVIEEGTSLVQTPSEEVSENPENLFGDSAFTKKSKKGRKKRKDSTITDSPEASGNSTPLDPLSEPIKTSLPSEIIAETNKIIPEQAVIAQDDIPKTADNELSSLSRKSSLKGKNKSRKTSKVVFEEPSGTSTSREPLELVAEPTIPTLSTATTAIEQSFEGDINISKDDVQQEAMDEQLDELVPIKKPKKDKNKAGSKAGIEESSSASIDQISEPIEPSVPSLSTESTAVEQLLDRDLDLSTPSATQEISGEPLDELAPIIKSKKDMKKRKDSSKANLDEPSEPALEPALEPVLEPVVAATSENLLGKNLAESSQMKNIDDLDLETPVIEQPQEDSGSSRKNSKKDKKKRKDSAKADPDQPSEPAQQISEPVAVISEPLPTKDFEKDVAESSQPKNTDETVQEALVTDKPQEESASLSRKNSKKDKKKRKDSSKVDLHQPSESAQQISEPIAAISESLPTGNSEQDVAKSSQNKNVDETAHETPVTDEPQDLVPSSRNSSKKDEKKRMDSAKTNLEDTAVPSVPPEQIPDTLEEAVLTSLPAQEAAEKDVLEPSLDTIQDAPGNTVEEALDEQEPTKKSKKDKKNRKSLATLDFEKTLEPSVPLDEVSQPLEEASQPLEEAIRTALPAEESVEKGLLEPSVESTLSVPAIDELVEEPAPTKKSKKDKKNKKSSTNPDFEKTSETSVFVEEASQPLEEASQPLGETSQSIEEASQPLEEASQPVEEGSRPLEEAVHTSLPAENSVEKDLLEPSVESIASVPTVDEVVEEPAPRKKSKKDKKKRRDSAKADLEEPSRSSTTLQAVEELNEILPTSSVPESVPEQQISAEQEIPRDELTNATSQDIVQDTFQEPEDELGSASTKKSKIDKKKRKSGLSTPVEDLVPALALPLATVAVLAGAVSESSKKDDEPEPSESREIPPGAEDEWGSVPAKKSKRDKKKRQSGFSTPVEELPEPAQPSDTPDHPSLAVENMPESIERSEDLPSQEIEVAVPATTENVGEGGAEWAAPGKKSKKDKKKRKSGISTPIEEPLPEVQQPVLEEKPQPSSSTTKILDETKIPKEMPILDLVTESAITKTVEETALLKEMPILNPVTELTTTKASEEITAPETMPILDPVNESTKTKALEEITASEEIPTLDPVAESTPRDIVNEKEDGWAVPGRKSKKDKKKRKSETPAVIEEPLPEVQQPVLEETPQSSSATTKTLEETTLPKELPTLDPTIPIETTAREIINEPEDERAPLKKSKKDKKKRNSGISTPLEEPAIQIQPPALEELPESSITNALEESTLIEEQLGRDTATGSSSREIIEEQEDERAPLKKSKKDKKKRNSGVSTPLEDPAIQIQPPTLEELPESPTKNVLEESTSIEEPFEKDTATEPPIKEVVEEAEEERAPTKKSKKDKKRKSGISTPLEETLPEIQQTASEEVPQLSSSTAKELEQTALDQPLPNDPTINAPASEIVNEAKEEWAPTKKDKKDNKNRKSEASTPVEQIFEPEIAAIDDTKPSLPLEPPSEEFQDQLDQNLPEAASKDAIDEPEQLAPTKKSKKDKKKRKSGIATPAEEIPEIETTALDDNKQISSELQLEPIGQTSSDITEPIVQDTTTSKEIVDQPNDEWEGASTSKKSKKDKKKRKSGLSTPIEETQSTKPDTLEDSSKTTPHPGPIDLFHANPTSSKAADGELPIHDQAVLEDTRVSEEKGQDSTVQGTQFQDIPVEEAKDEDALEDPFAFVTKRSKKEKKGKRAAQVDSESGPSASAPAMVPPPIETPETNPISLPEPETFSEQAIQSEPTAIPDVVESRSIPDQEHEHKASSISHKSSKKDKRKRRATIDSTNIASGSVPPPLTSWVDEVEEAQVERSIPVIEEIAKDESLSHIPSTTPSTPSDDYYSRPTKKGKKDKRKDSLKSEPTPVDDSFQTPIGPDMPSNDTEGKQSDVPIIEAAGIAAIAGVTLLSQTADTGTSSDSATPAEKLSKKEKKKMSIDKRAPREDMFDDPALWEGADPMVYEETKEGLDDEGNDGFWSPPQEEVEEPIIAREPFEEREELVTAQEPIERQEVAQQPHAHEASPSIDTRVETARARGVPTTSGSDVHESTKQTMEERQPEIVQEAFSPPLESSNDSRFEQSEAVRDEFVVPASKNEKDKESKRMDEREIEESIKQTNPAPTILPLTSIEPSTEFFGGPPTNKGISFENPPPMIQEHISASSRDLEQQPRIQRRAFSPELGRTSPTISHSITPRSSRPRLSDLPIVLEENFTQIEAEHHPVPHGTSTEEANRDSAFVSDSPIPPQRGFADHEHVRDSGVHLRDNSPAGKIRAPPVSSTDDAIARLSWPAVDEETETVDLHRSQRPIVKTPKKHQHEEDQTAEAHDSKRPKAAKEPDFYQSQRVKGEPLVIEQQARTPDNRDQLHSQRPKEESHTELHRTSTLHGRKLKEGNIVKQRSQIFESPDLPKPNFATPESQRSEIRKLDLQRSQTPKLDKYADLKSSPRPTAQKPLGISEIEAGAAIAGVTLGFAAARKVSQEKRPESASGQKTTPYINRLRTPDIKRPESVGSNRSGTPPLRRSDRQLSGDLRSLSQRSKPDLAKEAELAAITASAVNTANPTANEGRVRAKDMADVYDGFGEGRMGSPRSPTRPHSMRRRQSMQVLDLETKLEQLAAENRMLAEAKAQAERTLMSSQHASSSLVEKDAEIDSLKRTLEWLQHEVQRLNEVNEGLTSANVTISRQHADRYSMLETQHSATSRELQEARDAHNNLAAGMDGIVKNEVQNAVQEKDREIAQLRADLDAAKEQIREMQRQILASKANDVDFLTIRDEDYFDNACQQLCQHVQQWVLRFSKFSDMRACRLTSEISNDKTIDRLDNAILDGSDVDTYLADRVKRRDVFMSMTMTMIWEFVFTRYLFGMDREQRQKLKSLEKILLEVGPKAAVHQWRATTLTLLAKRQAFAQQREQDTQAVVHAILETLSEILPPPSHLEQQIEDQLTRVMKAAVDLSIEMRTQRAEYMMLPPLQPEYDANGDLASKVSFNSALMNERSGDSVSNQDLEAQKAVVRIVLFPLVVKKGDDKGEGDEEIVVCPAQVLVAPAKKMARFADGTAGNHSRVSMQSSMPADYGDYGEGSAV